jgi:glycosyltransferase involved in cell wall biosynthesis
MASGRPVIAAINGSAAEIISESKCGFSTNSGNIVQFSKLFLKMMKNDNLSKLGENGRIYMKKNFTLDNHINTIMNIFEKNIKEI